MISLEMMPPLMFCGLVLAMLIRLPVAFTLGVLGFFSDSFQFISAFST